MVVAVLVVVIGVVMVAGAAPEEASVIGPDLEGRYCVTGMHALMQEGAVSLVPGVLCEHKHWQSHMQQAEMLMIVLHAAMHDHTTRFCLFAH